MKKFEQLSDLLKRKERVLESIENVLYKLSDDPLIRPSDAISMLFLRETTLRKCTNIYSNISKIGIR